MRRKPGEVRDAIADVLDQHPAGASAGLISAEVSRLIGEVPASSVRSYLRLNTPELFVRMERGHYALAGFEAPALPPAQGARSELKSFHFGRTTLIQDDCLSWLDRQADESVHAVVTDPPYGLTEYSDQELAKLRQKKGGVSRIPPSFDGAQRAPLPRFTVLKPSELAALEDFFFEAARIFAQGGPGCAAAGRGHGP